MVRHLLGYFVAAGLSAILVTRLAAVATGSSRPPRKEIVRQDLQAQSQRESKARAERIERLRQMKLDHCALVEFLETYRGADRARLVSEGLLIATAPAKGTTLIRDEHRTALGNQVLQKAKDLLFGLLFGDDTTDTHFNRIQRELLTLTVPRHKAGALEFMKASTELTAAGIWQDPEGVSNDERVENVIIEVEYGETRDEWIGDGIVAAIALINKLEMNEQVLYARMIDIEQSTLIE